MLKHCGKRRNCSLQAISPFPTVFSKDSFLRHAKSRETMMTTHDIAEMKSHITAGCYNKWISQGDDLLGIMHHLDAS